MCCRHTDVFPLTKQSSDYFLLQRFLIFYAFPFHLFPFSALTNTIRSHLPGENILGLCSSSILNFRLDPKIICFYQVSIKSDLRIKQTTKKQWLPTHDRILFFPYSNEAQSKQTEKHIAQHYCYEGTRLFLLFCYKILSIGTSTSWLTNCHKMLPALIILSNSEHWGGEGIKS